MKLISVRPGGQHKFAGRLGVVLLRDLDRQLIAVLVYEELLEHSLVDKASALVRQLLVQLTRVPKQIELQLHDRSPLGKTLVTVAEPLLDLFALGLQPS